ncbi:hypothetical protein AAFF_G00211070 [Aldrovandia affinis]|uniref:Uncharacterized protein n=1 Tax=Aldrovandia affinis TaxID=143900 RepID=A0AAD7WUK7_9TELE|nr:hypothetical protein AAFF_G00211070 [Aldrovandia affinis]
MVRRCGYMPDAVTSGKLLELRRGLLLKVSILRGHHGSRSNGSPLSQPTAAIPTLLPRCTMILWMQTEEVALEQLVRRLQAVTRHIAQIGVARIGADVCEELSGRGSGPLMSLHSFLREGQETPYRIVSHLGQLLHSLSLSLLGPLAPHSRRGSWRDWNECWGGLGEALTAGAVAWDSCPRCRRH